MGTKSAKRDRFEKVAARRVQRILDTLESLSNCSNRANYEYSEDDVKKMFKAIREKISQTEAGFDKRIDKQSPKTFTF